MFLNVFCAIRTRFVDCLLCLAAFIVFPAGAESGGFVEITVLAGEFAGAVKPVNGVGQPPMIGAPRSFPMMHYLKDAGIPFSRLHDVGGAFGRMTYVDIPNLFRDFDADETDPASYDFAFTDRLVSALVENGVEPFFRLGVTIENSADIRAYRIHPPKDFAKWARICEHVVRHYNEGWANGFRHGIRYWEIWNEPDNMPESEKNPMWRGSFDDFMRFYGIAAIHLKQKFPHLKIGGYGSCGFYAPVGAGTVRSANSSPRAEYFVDCCTNFLTLARDGKWPLDFFSFHSYSRPEHAVSQVKVARRVLDEYGFTATETCFDEWLPEPQKFRCGTALAASKIAAEIIGLQNSSCDMAMIYDARCGVGDYSPLFNPMTQRPHKAYYAFVAFNELRKAGRAVPCKVSAARIWACAAKDDYGMVRVMLSNPCDEAVGIRLEGLSKRISCILTDENHTYERVSFSSHLPPHSFVLLEEHDTVSICTVGPGGGGWIESVLPSRHDPQRLLAGCDVGGFYFSPDGGRHWEIRNRGLGNPMVETIAEDPTDPNRILIGGDGGLYVSDNMGLEWRHLTNGLPRPKNKGHSLPVKRVAWDETNPRRIYAATGCPRREGREDGMHGHLYRSDDGGETWAMVVAKGDPLVAEQPTEIYDLSLSAKDGADLLALTSRGLFRSGDAGVDWRHVGTGLPTDTVAKAMSRSAADPNRVYLAMREKKPKPVPHEASVWRSDDGGETWTKTSPLPDFHRLSDGSEPMDTWGRSCIAVDPSDPDTVWCGGIWFKQGLCVSRDGGRSWKVAVDKLPYGWIDEFWHSPVVSLAVSRSNPSMVVFGTSSGIYRTEDGGATWAQRYTAERRNGEAIVGSGLDVLCVSEIVPDRFAKDRWFAAFYDVGLMVTDDAGRSWKRCMDGIPKSHAGICSTVAQSPTESNLCWSVFGTWGGGGRGLPARSTDGGRTWTLVKNPRGWTEGHAKNMQVLSSAAPYALAVAHAKKGLVTSCDGGESWAEMSTNALPCARRVVSLAAADGALYAGTAGRGGNPPQVWRSADKGRAWECIFAPASSEADGPIEGMAVSGRRIAVVVKCIGKRGGCWLSEDGGSTWRRVYHEKPWNDLNAVAFCGGRLFVASRNARWHDDGFGGKGLLSVGLYNIASGRWERHAEGGFDRPEIMCLCADPFDDGRLLVGTWGNSLSVLQIESKR